MSEENKVIEEMQGQAIKELTILTEENNEENTKVVNDAKEKIEKIFDDLKDWVKENSEPEKVKEALAKAKEDTVHVLKSTKEKAIEISNSDQFKNTLEAGKDFLLGAGGLIADGLKAGTDVLMKNETIKNIVEHADEKLDVLRESEGLKNAVNAAEEVTEKVTGAVFEGVKKFFDKSEDDGKDA